MSDKQDKDNHTEYMTFSEAMVMADEIYEDLQRRKQKARQAESDYWNYLSEDVPNDSED